MEFQDLRFIGALIVTYFVSRAMLFLLRRWRRNASGLVAAHAASWIAIEFVVGISKSHGYQPFVLWAGMIYLLPQLIWLGVDLARGQESQL
jgi:hypothetical protein